MKKIVTAVAFLATLSVPALAATDDELKQAIVGSWGDEATCSQGRLTFSADGTFTSGSAADPADIQKGTYTIANGKLNGSAGDAAMPEMIVTIEGGKIYLSADGSLKDPLYPCAPAQ
ncbi:MAG: lipocalin family protein [Bauldia sp.]